MDKNIVSIMQQACIFAVIAQMIFYLRPNETYEKYLKLLIGIILMAVLFIPLLNLLRMADVQKFQNAINDYEQNINKIYEKMYEGEVDFGELRDQIEGNQSQMFALEEEVKTRINNLKIENYYAEDVKITGVTYSEEQTDMENMKLEIHMKIMQHEDSIVKVETIKVEDGDEDNESYESDTDKIKELLESRLGIEKERVSIVLNE